MCAVDRAGGAASRRPRRGLAEKRWSWGNRSATHLSEVTNIDQLDKCKLEFIPTKVCRLPQIASPVEHKPRDLAEQTSLDIEKPPRTRTSPGRRMKEQETKASPVKPVAQARPQGQSMKLAHSGGEPDPLRAAIEHRNGSPTTTAPDIPSLKETKGQGANTAASRRTKADEQARHKEASKRDETNEGEQTNNRQRKTATQTKTHSKRRDGSHTKRGGGKVGCRVDPFQGRSRWPTPADIILGEARAPRVITGALRDAIYIDARLNPCQDGLALYRTAFPGLDSGENPRNLHRAMRRR